MNNWDQQVIEMIGRFRNAGKRTTSRAGSVLISTPCEESSRAASVAGIDKARVIADFMTSQGILV